MHNTFLRLFRCPLCKTPFTFDDSKGGDKIVNGILTCKNGHTFQTQEGVPNFADVQTSLQNSQESQDVRTVESFGFEWQWDHTPRTEEDLIFRVFEKPNIPKDFFQGKLVLDVGCGAGL